MMTTLALSRITGRPVAATSALAVPTAAPLQAARADAAAVPQHLAQILRPQAMGRWILPQLSAITPTYIEQALRGAFAGSHVQQWELFDLMEDTWPRLLKNLGEIKRAVAGLDWKLEPWAEEDTPPTDAAEERARLVSHACWRMRPDVCCDQNGFDETLRDLLDAWGKGCSVLEILWHIRHAGTLGDVTVPQATVWVPPAAYAWSEDGRLGLNPAALEQRGRGTRGYLSPASYGKPPEVIDFPEDKFLVAIFKAKTGHPLASALLRPLAWWWCAANFSADWLMNLAQIFGLPFRLGFYDGQASTETINSISSMLENMGSAAWGAFPAGTQIDLKEATKNGDNSPQGDLLDRADKNCDLLILGQTGTSEVGGVGKASATSGAATNVHNSVREEVVDGVAGFLATVLNQQFVPAILRQNYGDEEEAPEFCPARPDTDESGQAKLKSTTEAYGVAVRAGLVTPNQKDEEHFRKLNNLPPMPAEVKKAWKENPTREPITIQDESQGPVDQFGRPKTAGASPVPSHGEEGKGEGEPPGKDEKEKAAVQARSATDVLIDRGLEDLTGVQARWLGGLAAPLRDLMAKAATMTDEQWAREGEAFLTAAQRDFPDLFKHIDVEALAHFQEGLLGAAVVNGAVAGAVQRRFVKRRTTR